MGQWEGFPSGLSLVPQQVRSWLIRFLRNDPSVEEQVHFAFFSFTPRSSHLPAEAWRHFSDVCVEHLAEPFKVHFTKPRGPFHSEVFWWFLTPNSFLLDFNGHRASANESPVCSLHTGGSLLHPVSFVNTVNDLSGFPVLTTFTFLEGTLFSQNCIV